MRYFTVLLPTQQPVYIVCHTYRKDQGELTFSECEAGVKSVTFPRGGWANVIELDGPQVQVPQSNSGTPEVG